MLQRDAAEQFRPESLPKEFGLARTAEGAGYRLSDVQAQHRHMVRTIAGMPLVGSPVRLDGDRADSDLPPPALGEHTEDVLTALGTESDELQRLRSENVIG